LSGSPFYRHIAAFGGALNVLMMILANLVGFVLGTDAISEAQRLFSVDSMFFCYGDA
jgi:hypothetical protein